MPLLFSYGSLQDTPVQLATFGRHLAGERDALSGHTVVTLVTNGRACGNAVRGEAAALVAGTVFEVTDAELALADGYEAADGYTRRLVVLQSGRRAWIYVVGGAQ